MTAKTQGPTVDVKDAMFVGHKGGKYLAAFWKEPVTVSHHLLRRAPYIVLAVPSSLHS